MRQHQIVNTYKLVLILLILIICTTTLKHEKKQNKKKQDIAKTTVTKQKNDKVQQQKAKKTQVITKPEQHKKQQSNKQRKEKEKKAQNFQKQQKKQKQTQQKQSNQYIIQANQNQYTMPIAIGSDTYNLALVYDEKQQKYGEIPSWIFTSLTEQDHQLCDAEDDCQQVSKYIKCKDNQNCKDDGKAKYSTDILQSKKKAKIKFSNNKNNHQLSFVSPKKVTLSQNIIGENQISGMYNLALNKQNKYGNYIMLDKNIIKIIDQIQLNKQIDNKQYIQLNKANSLISFSNNKDIYLYTLNIKDKKQTNDIKENYHKIKLQFSNNQLTMAVPKNTYVAIKNILKKQYFGDRCKISGDKVICSAAPVKNITKISLCRESKGQQCIHLPIQGYILKQEKTDKSYKLLVKQNAQKDGQTTFIVYPKVAELYKIYGENGIVKGIIPTVKNSQQKTTQTKIQKQKQEKSTEQQSNQQTKQSQKKKDKQQHKQKEKQKQSKKQEQEQEQKQKQQQQSGKHLKKNQKQKQKEKQKQKKQKKQDEQQQEKQSQQQQQKQTKKKKETKNEKSSHKSSQKHTVDQKQNNGAIQQQRKYSKGILFFVMVYGLVFIGILVVIKLKAQQSLAAQMIDRFIDFTWYGVVKSYFNKSRGYNAPRLQQQHGGQDIDHSDSVVVGYTQKQGRDLFWEKNSVQGI